MSKPNNAILFESVYEAMVQMDPETCKEALIAYMEYYRNGTEYEGESDLVKILLTVSKPSIDNAVNRRNMQTENGRRGGRPKTQRNPNEKTETQNNPNEKLETQINPNEKLETQINPNEKTETQNNPTKPKRKNQNLDRDRDRDRDIDTDTDTKSIKEKQNKKKVAASAYVDDPELNAAICSFVESRKKLRKPMTDRAIELFISRVQKIGGSLSEQIDLINTAVEKGWLTVYPKSDKEGGWTVRAPAMTKFSNFEQRENNLDEFALAMAKKQMEVLNP